MPRQSIMRPYIKIVNRTVFYWWTPENKTPIFKLLFEIQHTNTYIIQTIIHNTEPKCSKYWHYLKLLFVIF